MAVTEVDDSTAGREERARLREELERQAEAVRAWLQERDGPRQAKLKVTPELQLMSGPPARTLDTIAAEDGYGLLVVGARGAGMSSVLLGSVATKLAARASVPVLIIGDQVGRAGPSAGCARSTRPTRVPDDQEDVLCGTCMQAMASGSPPTMTPASEKAQLVMADRFRLEKVRARTGPNPRRCRARGSSGPGRYRPRRWRKRWPPTRPPA